MPLLLSHVHVHVQTRFTFPKMLPRIQTGAWPMKEALLKQTPLYFPKQNRLQAAQYSTAAAKPALRVANTPCDHNSNQNAALSMFLFVCSQDAQLSMCQTYPRALHTTDCHHSVLIPLRWR